MKKLQALFSNSIKGYEKLTTLKELGVRVTDELKEGFKHMSGFGDALAASARENKAKEMDLSLLEQGVSYEMIAVAAKVTVEMAQDWEKEAKEQV